jgi:hypothetical protein
VTKPDCPPVLSDALDEFDNVVKIALDDLEIAIVETVPEEFLEEDIRQAFVDFDWVFARAMREFRQKLTTNTGGDAP